MVVQAGGGAGCMKHVVDAYDEVGGNLISLLEVMRVLESIGKGAGGEIQLTGAMAPMTGKQPLHVVTPASALSRVTRSASSRRSRN
ncbi:UTP--glucose-1-phosphate uridylyltransferase [Qipengyuania citrea LAMA 915]|uniref:UTP--glucose-1-phosphate uridylyltransferase n=1 Tax=Qipengyuania citrea LAMA 915 TaxID=1306953 RepID=A0A0L1KHW9_9SPHN|nr:hypothetical protein [Qipengyuania citrea]KNH03427.1 UTP--glucose-1-phosphate uridylyltransferase [Qipengyuania citrea LAMA 915]